MGPKTLVCLLSAASLGFAQVPPLEQLRKEALALVEARRGMTQQIVDTIYSMPELGYQETETSKYLTDLLEKNGFTVTRGAAGMPTSFVASWGSGKPVIAFMTDIDALPETSQKPGVPWHEPLIEGGPGHGEGHNSGQGVNIPAALALRDIMRKYKLAGTIRIYPGVAEELLGSRTYMVLAGMFKDVDVMLSAHVASQFATAYGANNSGLVSTQYTFHGRSAHAAGSPWSGRSALDAVELMDTAWNFRREHLRPEQRSHYVIVNGGDQPNVVPPVATVWYYFREWDFDRIDELHRIGTTIAGAAAQMTDTTMTERMLASTWPGHFNQPLAESLYENIKAVGMPQWSEADQTLARAAQAELKVKQDGLKTKVEDLKAPAGMTGGGSDDIAEVAWNLPTVVLQYPANIPGMTGHHWSSGIAMATPIAHKGATAGAKAQALTALDLLMKPGLLAAARQYFDKQTETTKWKPLIPVDTKAPTDLNRDKMARFRPQIDKIRYLRSKYKSYLEQLGVAYPTVKRPGQ